MGNSSEQTFYENLYAESEFPTSEGLRTFIFRRSERAFCERLAFLAKGADVIEIGCGSGKHAVFALQSGAKSVVATDVTEQALRRTHARAQFENLSAGLSTALLDVETTLPQDLQGKFGLIINHEVFSSVNLEKALPQLSSLLAPEGRLLGIETFGHNPILNGWRRLNVCLGRRTSFSAENILNDSRVDLLTEWFEVESLRYYHFFAVAAGALFTFFPKGLVAPFRDMTEIVDRGGGKEQLDAKILFQSSFRLETKAANGNFDSSLVDFMKVPYFDYPALFRADQPAFEEIFRSVAGRGAYIGCEELAEFERELASFCEAAFAIGVADGTDALIIALKAGGVLPGDEVIVCSHTMVATASACAWVGAVPVPVDCREDRLIDPVAVRKALTKRTKAILPTQLNGRVCDMDSLASICKDHGIFLFEDAAQALGARYGGRCAGTFGVAGTISFYPAKTLGAFGDGGAVLTNDPEVARRIRLLRDHGRNEKGEVECWGLNSRLDNLQAAILLHKLKRYPETIAHRRSLAARYHEGLHQIEQVILPPPPGDGLSFDIYQNYEIEAESRDQLRKWLADFGIGTLVQWGGKAVHQWKNLGFSSSLPRTELLFERCCLLPLNEAVALEHVDYIVSKVSEFYSRSR